MCTTADRLVEVATNLALTEGKLTWVDRSAQVRDRATLRLAQAALRNERTNRLSKIAGLLECLTMALDAEDDDAIADGWDGVAGFADDLSREHRRSADARDEWERRA